MISDENLDFKWTGEMRFEKMMDRDFIVQAKNGGCQRLMFGLESAVPRLIDLMEKEIDVEHAEKLLNYCYEEELPVEIFMISDYPTETPEESKISYDFVNKLPKRYGSTAVFTQFRLFRLSPMGQNPEKYGLQAVEEERESFKADNVN